MIKESNPAYSVKPQFGFQSNHKDHDWTLNLHCNDCQQVSNPQFGRYENEESCLKCVLIALNQEGRRVIKRIVFENSIFAPSEDIHLLVKLAEFYRTWEKTVDQNQPCPHKNCFLNVSPNFLDFVFYLIKQKDSVKQNLCTQCRKKLKVLLNNNTQYELTSLIKKIPDNDNWFRVAFIGPYSKKGNRTSLPNRYENEILKAYRIASFSLYTVSIYSDTAYESSLNISISLGSKSNEFYSAIVSNFEEKISLPQFDHLLPIGIVLEKYVNYVENYLKVNYHNLNLEEVFNIALFISVKKLNINKLFPLLVDSHIDEIYLDSPEETIYIDHRDSGRCKTSIFLTDQDINSIKTFLRISSNKRLDPTNPTIKCSIHNQYFHCRFAADICPIVLSGFSLNIRKMNRKFFTIPELIQREMLSSQIASFLLVCVLLRLNITAVGETNTGKTTLINSLDLLAPSHFRKIYIEESPESLDQGFSQNHQLKYLVDPAYSSASKIQEIYRLLHRNPDLVYLGEILTKEEAHAMFHCLSAGLRGFQTIHARDIDSLLNRWQYHFNIDPACYNDLDIIILLKRSSSKRYIAEVVELTFSNETMTCHPIFRFDPETSTWSNMPKLELLHCFQKKSFSKKETQLIYDQLSLYKTIFSSLSKKEDWDVRQHVHSFHTLYNKIEDLKKNDTLINWDALNFVLEVK